MIRLTEQEILEKTADIIASSLRLDRSKVTPDAHILNDLGAESLDLIEITMETESAFNISIPEKSILDTATEVFGPGVLEKDGHLTDAGKQLLNRRLPDVDRSRFEGDVSIDDIKSYFLTVQSWARMVYHLAQHTPSECAACQSELVPEAGFRLKCSSCGKEFPIRPGEDLNREWVQQFYETEYLKSASHLVAAGAAAPNGHTAAGAPVLSGGENAACQTGD
jgi:acyl carrier protein